MGETTKLTFSYVLALCFLSGVSAAYVKEVSQRHSEDWDTLILTQSWPPAECIFFRSECDRSYSENIRSWVIHGLWPTLHGTTGPNYCNQSWIFDISNVKDLEPRLNVSWPSISMAESSARVWCHEWDKHGTCGAVLPALKDQFHYFNVTLGLHGRFNLSKILESGKVVPSEDQAYSYSQVQEAFRNSIGSYPSLTCIEDKSNGKWYLEQIKVCLSKSFQPVNCTRHSGTHRRQVLLFRSENDRCNLRSSSLMKSSAESECDTDDFYYKPMPAF